LTEGENEIGTKAVATEGEGPVQKRGKALPREPIRGEGSRQGEGGGKKKWGAKGTSLVRKYT